MQEEGSQRYPSYCFVWRGLNISRRDSAEIYSRRLLRGAGQSMAFFIPAPCQVLRKLNMSGDEVRLLRPSVQRMSGLLEEIILKPEAVLIRLDSAGGFHDAIDPCIHSELSEFTRGQ